MLREHRSELNVRELIRHAYDLGPREQASLFKLIGELSTDSQVPDLLSRLEGRDHTVRMHLTHVVSKFDRPDVARALQTQLDDEHKGVRRTALEALASMSAGHDIEKIAGMLRDPDIEVQNRAVDLLVQLRHPDTIKYLIDIIQDESEFTRRSAVEVLNEIAEPSSIGHLFEALRDDDWWVSTRAGDALAEIGGPKVIEPVLELVSHDDERIRRAAVEILIKARDEKAVAHLIGATRDTDFMVRERAVDALGEIGSRKAVRPLLGMLGEETTLLPAVVRALGKLGDEQLVPRLLPLAIRGEKEVAVAAIGAVAALAGDTTMDSVRAAFSQLKGSNEISVAQAAAEALSRIEAAEHAFESQIQQTAQVAGGTVAAPPPPQTMLTGNESLTQIAAGAQATLDISTLTEGDVIEGRYAFIKKIGKGAFGTVLLVEDTMVNEQVILKFLNPNVSSDEEMLKRFIHELRYSRKITHRNVIRIYDFVQLGGIHAISMEYFPSHTLGHEIQAQRPLPFDKAQSWAADIATGMAVAHQVGIVHRDLKPANLLINDEGLLKIVDFGVAAAASTGDTQLTKTGYVIGSPKYMAPEQILGKKVDRRADIYSLGVIMYEMLTGSPPYAKGDQMSVMYQHVQGKAPPCETVNPDIPAHLAAVVRKAMAVDKEKRFETMKELRNALLAG